MLGKGTYRKYSILIFIIGIFFLSSCKQSTEQEESISSKITFTGADNEVQILTLNPGHFHAALVQKYAYDQVDSVVHIYAPDNPELDGHLNRINRYNQRSEQPTNWDSKVHKGEGYLENMIEERKGNVVVISGNNARKTKYIKASIDAGLNVLSDKPMVIDPNDFETLKGIFKSAEENDVLLYDVMTERYEITTKMQKALSQIPEVFGQLEMGSVDNPAITKESVHHFFKYVSGQPLIRPDWFFDVKQQGEGLVDVSTHLVDLVFWECFPDQIIDYNEDLEILKVKRWPTKMTSEEFKNVTGAVAFPEFLQKDVIDDTLQVYSNGETIFSVNGVHAKVSVIWNYQAPEGAADTHYSTMRGSKAHLVIRQGAQQGYKPALYVEPINDKMKNALSSTLPKAIEKLSETYPGLSYRTSQEGWEIIIPQEFKIGHEAHFAEVTEKYLQYLVDGKLPSWEVPNMLAKYYVTTSALAMSQNE